MSIKPLGDRILQEELDSASHWLNHGEASRTVNTCLRVMQKLANYLDQCSFDKMRATDAAKTATHLSKVVDEMARLVELVQGKPDSRTETKISELDYLTNDQFKQVCAWVEEGKARQTQLFDA